MPRIVRWLVLFGVILPQQVVCFVVGTRDSWQPHLSATKNFLDDGIRATRRQLLASVIPSILAGATATTVSQVQPAFAEDTIWLTGKDPKVPGKKPRDKNDVSGTRKDPNFLRSLADCKNQCENTIGSDGYAKTKEECLSECQDICCTTYQQCTFAIVQRI
jgi:hypothetical protein